MSDRLFRIFLAAIVLLGALALGVEVHRLPAEMARVGAVGAVGAGGNPVPPLPLPPDQQ